MLIPTLLSLLGIGCYACALGVLLLTRQGAPLLCSAVLGCLAFGLAAWACRKRGHRLLCALHAVAAAVAAVLSAALLVLA